MLNRDRDTKLCPWASPFRGTSKACWPETSTSHVSDGEIRGPEGFLLFIDHSRSPIVVDSEQEPRDQ
jgi:hypothetical protein